MNDRHTADSITSDALDALYDEIDRLRAGEEDGYDPLAVPTPGQWIHQFNQATAEKRLEVVGRLIDAAERVWACTMNRHEERIHDGRHAEMALNEVRQVVADMAAQGALQWAGWLRDAMKRGPKHCLLCAVEAKPEPSGPAGTEVTEEQNLVHALGGDRTAKTIAHTLTVHGHTLDAVRTMTYAELLAVPGIGGPSLARIREALDGCPEPDGTDQAERCCVCGSASVVYHNHRERPFCWACADCPCGQDVCIRTGLHRTTAEKQADTQAQIEELERNNRALVKCAERAGVRRDQLAVALQEVLSVFRHVNDNATRTTVGYVSAPVHPADYDRWRAVLNPPKEQH